MRLPDVYLSGGFDLDFKTEQEMLKRSGCRHRCFSAAFVVPGNIHYSERVVACQKASEAKKTKIMLDSGAFTLHKIQQASQQRGRLADNKKTKSVEELQQEMYDRYTTYVKDKLKKKAIEFFVTLDFIKHQPTVFAMQKKFAKDGLVPSPVFHGDTDLTWLKKYADLGVKLVCIGTIQTRTSQKKKLYYFDSIFNEGEKLGLKFHGLATTRLTYLWTYPFWSVDSASWTKMAGYGCILVPSGRHRKMVPFHVTDRVRGGGSSQGYKGMSPDTRKMLRDYLEGFGFDLLKMRSSSVEREIWNAFAYTNLEKCGVDVEYHAANKVEWENML